MLQSIKARVYSWGLLAGKSLYHNRESKVLYYHDIHEDSDMKMTEYSSPLSLFKEHIKVIREQGFEIVDEISQPQNQIMITFDDGFSGVFKNRQFFIEENIKPTIFIISESIGKQNFLTEAEILLLKGKGFRFQSHTHTHPDLNLLTVEQLELEFETSKKILENLLSTSVDEICFPKGFFNNKVVDCAKKVGYTKLFASIPGNFYEKNIFGVVYRNLVQFTGPSDLKLTLYGGPLLFRSRYIKQHYHEKINISYIK